MALAFKLVYDVEHAVAVEKFMILSRKFVESLTEEREGLLMDADEEYTLVQRLHDFHALVTAAVYRYKYPVDQVYYYGKNAIFDVFMIEEAKAGVDEVTGNVKGYDPMVIFNDDKETYYYYLMHKKESNGDLAALYRRWIKRSIRAAFRNRSFMSEKAASDKLEILLNGEVRQQTVYRDVFEYIESKAGRKMEDFARAIADHRPRTVIMKEFRCTSDEISEKVMIVTQLVQEYEEVKKKC